jgi:hypothetical protein
MPEKSDPAVLARFERALRVALNTPPDKPRGKRPARKKRAKRTK